MTIETQLTQRDFSKLTFILLFKRFSFFFIILANLILLVSALVGIFVFKSQTAIILVYASIAFLSLLLFSVYNSSKRQFQHNPRMQVKTTYQFNTSGIMITRGGVDSRVQWKEVKSIRKQGSLILIWQNKLVAHVLAKRDFSPEQLESLRNIALEQNKTCSV